VQGSRETHPPGALWAENSCKGRSLGDAETAEFVKASARSSTGPRRVLGRPLSLSAVHAGPRGWQVAHAALNAAGAGELPLASFRPTEGNR
jgi:hypothetical protein